LAVHLFEGARGEEPLEDSCTSDAQRFFEALVGAGSEAVQGDAEGVDSEFGHLAFLVILENDEGIGVSLTSNMGWEVGFCGGRNSVNC
jgi:hypothetical protein